jgi:hypothetical protein
VDGSGNLYVANYYAGTIGKYTTTGSTLNASLVTGLRYPLALALDQNGHLFVGNCGTNNNAYYAGRGTVGEYTTAGEAVNASLIAGLTQPMALVAVSMAVPPPSASLLKAVKPTFSNLFVGINYQLQLSGNMSTWTN